ncbi:uncharacterized protein LOC127794304 [Diospyros lotus]|uniref:uncharacterized protein LOC127794304 n=1 Tax=Diospyros lotus TaxID=55363 RepID=UPI002251E16D|nr:uncharacterized protein LOC127794304 [Diospyros lotus]XP_052181251.1 uncharacterized protein LOC127794304 [Diospyros lotus]
MENCQFLHYCSGGYNEIAFAPMMNLPLPPMSSMSSSPAVQARMGNKYNPAEGCKPSSWVTKSSFLWRVGAWQSFSIITGWVNMRTGRTAKPYDVLLKLNFGEGCSCVCTQIKFTIDFQRNVSTHVGLCISGR